MTLHELLLSAVDDYLHGLHGCDISALDAVFHPSASLFDVDDGDVRVDPYPRWREAVAARRSPADAGQARDEQVLSTVWLSTAAATVHLRVRVVDEVFVDHLTLVLDDGRFRIVAKTWHLEHTLTGEDRLGARSAPA